MKLVQSSGPADGDGKFQLYDTSSRDIRNPYHVHGPTKCALSRLEQHVSGIVA